MTLEKYLLFLCVTLMALFIFRIIDWIIDRKTWREKALDALQGQADLLEKQYAILSAHYAKIAMLAEVIVELTEGNAKSLKFISSCIADLDDNNITNIKDKIEQELSRLEKTQDSARVVLENAKTKKERLNTIDFEELAIQFFKEEENL